MSARPRRRILAWALAALVAAHAPPAGAATGPFAADAGVYHGLLRAASPSHAGSGSIRIKVAATGAFAAKLTLGGATASFKGTFDGTGTVAALPVPRKGLDPLVVDLQLELGAGGEGIAGSVQAGPVTALLEGERFLYTAKAAPVAPFVNVHPGRIGHHALRIEPVEDAPGGNDPLPPCYAKLTVSKGGAVKVAGLLPDGTKVKGKGFLASDGAARIYAPLYRKKGAFIGRIPIPIDATPVYAEGHHWFRPADPANERYPTGWPAGLETGVEATQGAPVLFTLTVSKSGAGTGTVTSDPEGIDYGEVRSWKFLAGSLVTLTATPDDGMVFEGWSGAGSGEATRVVLLDGNRSVTAAFAADPFVLTVDYATGLVTFPNPYTGWSVGGGSATNFVAYPGGWSVGGGSATNYVALAPGWTAGGGSATNWFAKPPGWSTGGGSATNYVGLPPGWSTGGGSLANYVALAPGWTSGGGSATNYTALPPGWSTGGGSATNYIALPPGWSAGGGSATNYVGIPPGQGWTVGGGSATNYTALPPGWTAGGGSATHWIAVPPGWVVGGGSATNYVTYPGAGVTTIQLKYDDPGWLACIQALQDSGSYTDRQVADFAMAAFLNLRAGKTTGILMEAPAGEW